jgi:hypothetical protein
MMETLGSYETSVLTKPHVVFVGSRNGSVSVTTA